MNTPGSLEAFYVTWSNKDCGAIESDGEAATRKAEANLAGLPREAFAGIEHVAEVGCGYGGFIVALRQRRRLKSVTGFDLPVESAVFDNYCTPKEYPGSRHSNGQAQVSFGVVDI